MEDTEIIKLYWNRSENAIAETAKKYGKYCHSIAMRIVRDEEDAKECVNDTWLRAWNAIPPGRPEKLSAFLGKISRNLALDRCKSKAAKKRGQDHMISLSEELEECLVGMDGVEGQLEEQFLTECINRFLETLPPPDRVIFVLRYWHAYSVQEIADRFGMNKNRVASILFRVRKSLKKYLEKEGVVL